LVIGVSGKLDRKGLQPLP